MGIFRRPVELTSPESANFPVISLFNSEFGRREQFAPDCVIHHPVSKVSDISENRSKFTRVRAISDQHMDPESGSGGADREKTAKPIPARFA
jgi:hypothetical protein